MRNLKRALSLALASVMLLGMMVVGTSAASINDFTDVDEINNKEAVAIATGLGIFDGYTDGSFGPEKAVTRAEAAVVIAKILHGSDVNPSNLAGAGKFTDVPAWAEGYVNLVAALKIIEGRGAGIFDPNATVTTVEYTTMLLKALGYYVDTETALDADWMLEVTSKANALGLYGDLELGMTAPLSREDVAALTFNTLFAQRVAYNDYRGQYVKATDRDVVVTNGTVDDMNTLAQNTFGLYSVEGEVVANGITHEALAALPGETGLTTVVFDETVDLDKDGKKDYVDYDFEYETGLDLIGHKVDVYYKLVKGNPVVFTMVDMATNVATLTYTTDTTKLAKAANDAGFKKNTILNIDEETYVVNYGMETTADEVYKTNGAFDKTLMAADAAAGRVAKNIIVISNSGNYEVDYVIVLDQKLDQVSTVKTKDDVTTYTLKKSAGVGSKAVAAYEAAKDDYVIVTNIGMKGRYVFEAAELADAEITKVTGKTGSITLVTADGEDYVQSPVVDLGVATTIYQSIVDLGSTTLILDQAGKLIGLKGETTPAEYAYVAYYGVQHINYKADTKDVLVAHVYFADGTNKVIQVSDLSDATVFTDAVLADPDTYAGTQHKTDKLNGGTYLTSKNEGTDGLGVWQISYDSDDNIILTAIQTSATGGLEVGDDFIKGHSTIIRTENNVRTNVECYNNVTKNDVMYQNSDTVYFFVNGTYGASDFSVVPFTGVKNIPAFDVEELYNGTDKTKANVAQLFVKLGTTVSARNTVTAVLVEDEPMETATGMYYYNKGSFNYVENADGKIDLTYFVYDMDGNAQEITYTVKNESTAKTRAYAKETGFYQMGSSDLKEYVSLAAPNAGATFDTKFDNFKTDYVVNAGVSTDLDEYDDYVENFFDDVTSVGAIFGEETIIIDTCNSGLLSVSDVIAEIKEGAKITISYRYNNESYESGIVFITSYIAPATTKPGAQVNTSYKMVVDGYTPDPAETEVKFNIYTKEGALVANETSAEYTYEVEMLNGGVWVETLSDAGVATFANGNFTFDVPVNTDTNSVAIRITITATTATSGSVSSVIVVAAQ